MPSKWEQYSIESRIRKILQSAKMKKRQPHLGRPFLTPYQLALEFKRRWRTDFDNIGMRAGGKGRGPGPSLAQYLARELSDRIKDKRIRDIEGALVDQRMVHTLKYRRGREVVESTAKPLSAFRLKG